jgi:hypothetical protein
MATSTLARSKRVAATKLPARRSTAVRALVRAAEASASGKMVARCSISTEVGFKVSIQAS